MTVPCESKEDILELQKAMTSMGINGNKLEDALVRMAQAHERQTDEIREMTQTITAHMLDNREFRINLNRGKEERSLLFSKVRKLEEGDVQLTAISHNLDLNIQSLSEKWNNVDPAPRLVALEKGHNRIIGGLVIVPGFFTFISLCLVFYSAIVNK